MRGVAEFPDLDLLLTDLHPPAHDQAFSAAGQVRALTDERCSRAAAKYL
jgi:hypothetical protein